MKINRTFIHQVINAFYAQAKNVENTWCSLSAATPTNSTYPLLTYQYFYALRFIPAYYFEYCILAELLNHRLQLQPMGYVSVASLGCGLSPDYYALLDNLSSQFQYTGFDAVSWQSSEMMPLVQQNFKRVISCISTIRNVDSYNVFIFPKSISDIYSHNNLAITNFANNIAKTKLDRIFFLNSFVNKNLNSPSSDVAIFSHIDSALKLAGFKTTDSPNTTHYRGDRDQGLKGINYGFDYPNHQMIKCARKDPSNLNCNSCTVTKHPILNNSFMDYQILEYTR